MYPLSRCVIHDLFLLCKGKNARVEILFQAQLEENDISLEVKLPSFVQKYLFLCVRSRAPTHLMRRCSKLTTPVRRTCLLKMLLEFHSIAALSRGWKTRSSPTEQVWFEIELLLPFIKTFPCADVFQLLLNVRAVSIFSFPSEKKQSQLSSRAQTVINPVEIKDDQHLGRH